ncbi:hypothetical protein ACX1C1_11130 [Paenibacillus sp. strain BS8-2]
MGDVVFANTILPKMWALFYIFMREYFRNSGLNKNERVIEFIKYNEDEIVIKVDGIEFAIKSFISLYNLFDAIQKNKYYHMSNPYRVVIIDHIFEVNKVSNTEECYDLIFEELFKFFHVVLIEERKSDGTIENSLSKLALNTEDIIIDGRCYLVFCDPSTL